MHKSTDEEILTILSKNESLSIAELSSYLNLTKADIRYHIKRLLSIGSINEIGPTSGKRGRPANRYKIDNSYFAHNLITLINSIFSIVPINDEDISKMAKHISSKIETSKAQLIINKFNDLVIGLNKQHYQARWEIQYQGPIIYFSNCPYRDIVQNNSVLCDLDKKIIEEFLNKKVSVSHTIHQNGTKNCKFHISI